MRNIRNQMFTEDQERKDVCFHLPASILNLPQDVEVPSFITVHGEYSGASDEIIVVRQIRREVLTDAYVCHVTSGPEGTGIYDMPNFWYIKLGYNPIHVCKGFRFTMACIAESETNKTIPFMQRGIGWTNWLY